MNNEFKRLSYKTFKDVYGSTKYSIGVLSCGGKITCDGWKDGPDKATSYWRNVLSILKIKYPKFVEKYEKEVKENE